MGVSTRAKAEEPKKIKKSTSASRLLSMMKHGKPTVAPKPSKAPPKVAPKPQAPPKVAPKPQAPPKVAPKPSRSDRPVVPPKPPRRKSQPYSDGIGLAERSKSIRSPTRRSSGRLPKPAKTPGWSSPNEESFRRPMVAPNRRTSIYQKRIRQSLFDTTDVPMFSPSKTRRRSVYGPLPTYSPPKPKPRRSMVPTLTTTNSRLPTPVDYVPFVVNEPIYEEIREPPNKPQPKKRRPVCGVAALRRQSVLPEVVPERGPVLVCESFEPRDEVDSKMVYFEHRDEVDSKMVTTFGPRDEVDSKMTSFGPVDSKIPNENVLDKSVEIVEMEETPLLLTPPGGETGDGDGDFYTPAGRALFDSSLYETPAVKVNKVTPSCRLPSSVSTRKRCKTPRRTGNKMATTNADFEILPVHMLEPLELNDAATLDEATPEIVNGHSGDKNDSSKCVIS